MTVNIRRATDSSLTSSLATLYLTVSSVRFIIIFVFRGIIDQLGERSSHTHSDTGSSPVAPAIIWRVGSIGTASDSKSDIPKGYAGSSPAHVGL